MKALISRLFGAPGRLVWHYCARMLDIADRSQLGLMAAGVAFFGFLAVFPAAAASIAILGFVWDPAVINSQLSMLDDFLPPAAFDLVEQQVQALVEQKISCFGRQVRFEPVDQGMCYQDKGGQLPMLKAHG